MFVQVGRNPRLKFLVAWTKYGKSCTKDTRIVFATDRQPTPLVIQFLQDNRIGLYLYSVNRVVELLPPHDLAINIGLPNLADFHGKVRHWLAPTYEKFEKGDWFGGFEEACKLLEEKARLYFRVFSQSGRIKVMTKTGPTTLLRQAIEKLTMGQLKQKFEKIVSPTGDDQQTGDALARINADRIGVTHKKNKAATEKRLRKNVGHHMWVIISALQILSKHI
ncbi:MAG TPA: hypothetical protein VHE58_06660 [Burkholderiales bacterium]|nr:hypothetical protein [Burkholderiales bacterium]